jgi:mRNA interferase MazF
MARVLRGDVFWVDLEKGKGHEQHGTRPVLIISNDIFNERSGTVIAVLITGTQPRAGFPLTYELPVAAMPQPSWVKISQIRTLASERLRERVTHLPPEDLVPILEGLNEILGA